MEKVKDYQNGAMSSSFFSASETDEDVSLKKRKSKPNLLLKDFNISENKSNDSKSDSKYDSYSDDELPQVGKPYTSNSKHQKNILVSTETSKDTTYHLSVDELLPNVPIHNSSQFSNSVSMESKLMLNMVYQKIQHLIIFQ